MLRCCNAAKGAWERAVWTALALHATGSNHDPEYKALPGLEVEYPTTKPMDVKEWEK